MNEREFERSLGEWMHDGRSGASPWVLESVLEHVHRHPNQPWWRRLRGRVWSATVMGDHSVTHRGPRPLFGMATVAACAIALVIVALVVTSPGPTPDLVKVVAPIATMPSVEPSSAPRLAGLTGSLWLDQPERGKDSYVMLHPDGTAVTLTRRPGRQIGIGVWRPTSEHSLSTAIAYPDADPVGHIRYGFSIYRADWTLDDAAETATMTWTATFQPGDGSTMPDATGSSALTRLHLLALPPTAMYPVPAESPWVAALGPMVQGAGSGGVAEIAPCTDGEAPDFLVTHGDGTYLYTGIQGGSGIGLWAPTGPETRALTAWYGSALTARSNNWVGELTGSQQIVARTGTPETFDSSFVATARAIEAMDGPLPAPDATLWPTTGSVWLEPTERGTAIIAFLTDGTVVARDPRYGTGIGFWQPIDGDTMVSSIAFTTRALQDHHIWAESTITPDGTTLSIRYKHVDESAGSSDTGTATAAPLQVEP